VQGLRFLTIIGAAVVSLSSVTSAQEPQEAEELQPAESSILERSGDRAYEVVTPSLGRGYVGYELPAVDSCPCSNDRCFSPCRYYFGGKPYLRSWRHRWLSAHLGHGSMLDAYPCQCLSPGLTRPYWRPVSTPETGAGPTPADDEGTP
jgi:hypothetical protein